MHPTWLSGRPGAWLLHVHAQPGARVAGVVGEHGDALKIRIAAPPIEGKANEALLRWLAGRLRLPQRELSVLAGATSRSKRVQIASALSAEMLIDRLLAAPD